MPGAIFGCRRFLVNDPPEGVGRCIRPVAAGALTPVAGFVILPRAAIAVGVGYGGQDLEVRSALAVAVNNGQRMPADC